MFQNLYSPASAAQHPQPCLLLPRRSNECRFPSHHTKTAHDLYSPALPRARGGVQVFSTFRPQMFQNLYSPASPGQHEPHRNRTAQNRHAVHTGSSEPNRTGNNLSGIWTSPFFLVKGNAVKGCISQSPACLAPKPQIKTPKSPATLV